MDGEEMDASFVWNPLHSGLEPSFHSFYRPRELADATLDGDSSSVIVEAEHIRSPNESSLSAALRDVLGSGRWSDFEVCVDGRSFAVHRVILGARSPYFEGLLEAHTGEAASGRVAIPDVSYEVMQAILLYMYTGTRPTSGQLEEVGAHDLLMAANRFMISELKAAVAEYLARALTADTACETLVVADMVEEKRLKSHALRYIAHNQTRVTKSSGWENLLQRPKLVTECFEATATATRTTRARQAGAAASAMSSLAAARSGLDLGAGVQFPTPPGLSVYYHDYHVTPAGPYYLPTVPFSHHVPAGSGVNVFSLS